MTPNTSTTDSVEVSPSDAKVVKTRSRTGRKSLRHASPSKAQSDTAKDVKITRSPDYSGNGFVALRRNSSCSRLAHAIEVSQLSCQQASFAAQLSVSSASMSSISSEEE